MTIDEFFEAARGLPFTFVDQKPNGNIRLDLGDGSVITDFGVSICPIAAVANKLLHGGARHFNTATFAAAAFELGLDKFDVNTIIEAADWQGLDHTTERVELRKRMLKEWGLQS